MTYLWFGLALVAVIWLGHIANSLRGIALAYALWIKTLNDDKKETQ